MLRYGARQGNDPHAGTHSILTTVYTQKVASFRQDFRALPQAWRAPIVAWRSTQPEAGRKIRRAQRKQGLEDDKGGTGPANG